MQWVESWNLFKWIDDWIGLTIVDGQRINVCVLFQLICGTSCIPNLDKDGKTAAGTANVSQQQTVGSWPAFVHSAFQRSSAEHGWRQCCKAHLKVVSARQCILCNVAIIDRPDQSNASTCHLKRCHLNIDNAWRQHFNDTAKVHHVGIANMISALKLNLFLAFSWEQCAQSGKRKASLFNQWQHQPCKLSTLRLAALQQMTSLGNASNGS